MKICEGKTWTDTMPVYLNSLIGKGVYVVTVNEFQIVRDAHWIGQLYNFLGLTAGINLHDKQVKDKKKLFHVILLIQLTLD